MTKQEMQQSQAAESPARTLATLRRDLLAFEADGSRLARAKLHNNVIRPALLPIPIEWVCIPALHLDLAIYMWMFDAMIADVRQLDMALAAQVGQSGTHATDSTTFSDIAMLNTSIDAKRKEQEQLQMQINTVQSQVRHTIF